jgi:DnaD/phage-associated family protein
MARDYVCLYHSYLDAIQALGDAERGRLLTAMLEYSITGAAPQLGGNERYIFPMVKAQIDRDREKYEEKCRKNAEKGRLGGRPPKAGKAVAFSESSKSQGKGKGEGKGKGKEEAAYAANAREAALGAVLSHYQDCITPTPPSTVAQLLIAYTDELGPDVVTHAIDEAVNQRKLTWSYIQAILQRYSREGLNTLAKVEADELAKAQRKAGEHAGGGNIFAQMIQEGDL